MIRDVRGHLLSTASRAAAESGDEATELFSRYSARALEAIDAALARDPSFVMGHCIKAGMIVAAQERPLEPALRAAVEAGEALAPSATDRERAHLAAARAWLEGDFDRAAARYARLAAEHPRDLLAIQVAHLCDFMLGRSSGLRDHVAQVLHAWDPAVPGYAQVLGMYAFGLEETGDMPRAEEAGRRAVELDPRDGWASHAVAHVMEMQGRLGEGGAWIEETAAAWEPDNGLSFHNWWHRALFLLDAGDAAGALELYDRRIRPGRSDVALEMIDAAALLWRMHLRGHDTGDRFAALAEDWARRLDDGYYAFNDAHALAALLGAGRAADAARLLRNLERDADAPGTNGRMVREVGLPVARGLAAFARGDFAGCAEELLAVREGAARFGGSHAQRDLLSLTALEAALRGGLGALARSLASERTRVRPTNPFGWVATARALDASGDLPGAARARERAALLAERARTRRRVA
jgi:tetratricopeptide (TPR) repeat protein